MPTLKCVTLGCKVNQYETEYLREALERLGYREAHDGEPVDLCVVNTCTVTATSDAKSRKAIRRLGREHPQARIIVMGCYATRAPEQLAALPGVVEVVTDKRRLPELLARCAVAMGPSAANSGRPAEERKASEANPVAASSPPRLSTVDQPDRDDLPRGISRFGTRHRAYVKVQDGCRMRCAYCIIPLVRSVLSSRPIPEVLDEVQRLVDRGYRELVLTGIHLGHYGCESPARACAVAHLDSESAEAALSLDRGSTQSGAKLVELVRRVAELPGDFRLRLSSLEAADLSDELVELMADRPDRICPHLHLAMQSGSDRVLRRMRRGPVGVLLERCKRLAASLDQPALTTDVIVGFPGETDEDFEATCRVIEQAGFSKLHVFPFSPRKGTPAADMPDQLPQPVIRRRARQLDELGRRLRRQYMEQLLGRRLGVLVEEVLPGPEGRLLGTAERYVPVELAGPVEWCGRLVEVEVDHLAQNSKPGTQCGFWLSG